MKPKDLAQLEKDFVKLVLVLVTVIVLGLPRVGSADQASGSQFERPPHFGIDLEFSPVSFPTYQYTSSVASSQKGSGLIFNLEWLPITDQGKFALGLTLGASVVDNVVVNHDPTAGEQYATLYAFPFGPYLAYRFDYFGPSQILIPFVKVGTSFAITKQRSNFGYDRPGVQTYFGIDYGLGASLCMNWIEKTAARGLYRSVGIQAVYMVFEYLKSGANSQGVDSSDLSGSQLRLGLRFEL